MITGGISQAATGQYYQPYYDSIAQRANALGTMPFTPYSGQIAPGVNQYSSQAAEGLANFSVPWQVGWGSDRAAEAIDMLRGETGYQSGSIASSYDPRMIQMFAKPADSVMFERPEDVQMFAKPGDIQMYQKPSDVQMFARPDDIAANFEPGKFDAEAIAEYMNPYLQNVVDIQKREAERAFALQQQQRAANAVQQGAFGGSRAALVDQAARRDQNMLLDDIQAKGSAAAFTEGSKLFEADRQARALASQMGLTADQFNAQQAMQYGIAGLGADQFNKTMAQQYGKDWLNMQDRNVVNALTYGGLGLDADKFNRSLAMDFGKTGLQNQQFNIGTAMDYGKTGLLNEQFNETSRYKAADMSLRAQIEQEAARARAAQLRQAAMSGIGQLGIQGGQLGLAGSAQQLQALTGLGSLGNQMWNQEFQGNQANYQDYMTQQMFPYQQLAWEKNIMAGLPGPTLESRQYGSPNTGAGAGIGNLAAMAGILLGR